MNDLPLGLLLFGRPTLMAQGERLLLPAERRTMLLCLLAERGDWMTRAEAAQLLWPTLARERALANLRKTLHQARAWPYAAGIEAPADMLRWRVATDLQQFEQARRAGSGEQALALRRGPLLDGLEQPDNASWTEWLDGLRAQHARHWHALTRVHLQALQGEPERAVAFAQSLLQADAFDEDALVALLSAQRALGLFDAQRQTLQHHAARWRDELGIEPSARVRAELAAPPRATPVRGVALADGDDGGDPDGGHADDAGPLVGRAALVDDVLARLEAGARLLTLTGVAGVGKSSLLKVALRRCAATRPSVWIALDDLDEPTQVRSRLAAELGVRVADGEEPLAAVIEALAATPRLLAFDNAEHLPGLGPLLARLLQAHPQQRIVATSRQRLGLPDERLLRLEGLALPAPDAPRAAIRRSAAWRLFAAVAREAQADFDAEGQAIEIAGIVRQLEGLPLAIVLAARWVRFLSPARIAADLAESLDLLEGEEDGEERAEHRSVRATLERAWTRLGAAERACLSALSVLPGAASRRAAQEVGAASLPVLAQLADASLLRIDADGRVSLHPLIRQFAAEHLDETARAAAMRRHALFHLHWMRQLYTAIRAGDESAVQAVRAEIEHARQAWRWALAQADGQHLPHAAMVLAHHYRNVDSAAVGAALLCEAEPVLGRLGPAPAATVCTAIAQVECRPGRMDGVAEIARRAVAHARASGRRDLQAAALMALANDLLRQGRWMAASRAFEQSERHARACHDEAAMLSAMQTRVAAEGAVGRNDRAAQLLDDIVRLRLQRGQHVAAAMALNNLSFLRSKEGRYAEAATAARKGLALCPADTAPMPTITQPYLHFSLALALLGQAAWDDADRHCIEAATLARRRGDGEMLAAAAALRVRAALGRGDPVRARARLREALPLAAAGPHPSVQLDLVLSHLRLQVATLPARTLGAWAHWCLEQSAVAPADRDEINALLAQLNARDRKLALSAPPARMSLDEALGAVEAALADPTA